MVTGATGQLGRQCVKAFEGAGWNTVGTGEFSWWGRLFGLIGVWR